ncbi:MAG TPA: hypothetical protein VKB51_02645 [bacterium]|nr:hypothetical protein [bacterium]
MREMLMIRQTVRRIGKQLEQLIDHDVPMTRAFDILSNKARSIEEIVVVEVMREVYQESVDGDAMRIAYADSSTRSARMPAMAFSR